MLVKIKCYFTESDTTKFICKIFFDGIKFKIGRVNKKWSESNALNTPRRPNLSDTDIHRRTWKSIDDFHWKQTTESILRSIVIKLWFVQYEQLLKWSHIHCPYRACSSLSIFIIAMEYYKAEITKLFGLSNTKRCPFSLHSVSAFCVRPFGVRVQWN